MSDRDEFSSFLVGFIIGGLTGALVSLLLAPQSGEETRAVIREKAIELQEKASETAEDVYSRGEVAFSEVRDRGREIAEDLQRRGQVILEEQKARMTSPAKPAGPEKAAPAGDNEGAAA
jgi:gas vesicle protein